MNNKILMFCLFVVAVVGMVACGVKTNNFSKIEEELIVLYENDFPAFERKFSNLIVSDTSTLSYPFQHLDTTSVSITTSEDGNLRFYNWITPLGGTMPNLHNIVQYRSEGKIYLVGNLSSQSYNVDDNQSTLEGEYSQSDNTTYVKIHTIKVATKTYYLVCGFERYDPHCGISSISALTIENGDLKLVELFKTKTKSLSSISIEYVFSNWYFRANDDKCYDWLFALDEKTNTLYVPIVDDNISFGYITDQYLLYQLKDHNFQYSSTDGGYWLHPNIRKFSNLESIFNTKNYRIRIDRMKNGKYRYASWSRDKSMGDKPDLILENGSRHVANINDFYCNGYVFTTKEYKYEIRPIAQHSISLVVWKNGEVILSENSI